MREVDSGPHWHLPWPVEEVLKPSVTQILKEEIGFRTTDPGPPARYQDMDNEALMLTGDENIVKLQFIVQYKVRTGPDGVTDYLFNVRDPRETVRSGAEAAMREVVGRTASTASSPRAGEVQQEARWSAGHRSLRRGHRGDDVVAGRRPAISVRTGTS